MKRNAFVNWSCVIVAGLLLGATLRSHAAHVYVSASGNQTANYDSWATAFTNLQDALDHVMANAAEGANVYLAGETFEDAAIGGTHPETSAFLLQSASNIVIRGGYEANIGSGGSPGANNPDAFPTVLRLSSDEGRVLTLVGVSNVVVEGFTIRDGFRSSAGNGGGVYVEKGHNVTFEGVRILNNQVSRSSGGGVYLDAACDEIAFSSCSIISNFVQDATGHAYHRGGGVYTAAGSVLVTNSVISHNTAHKGTANYAHARGGGMDIHAGTVVVRRSIFRANQANLSQWGRSVQGGAINVADGATLDAAETVFIDNSVAVGTWASGGAAIANEGTLRLRNILVAGNETSNNSRDGIWLISGSANLVNCTIAYNNRIGLFYDDGTFAMSNSIAWGHIDADLLHFPTDTDGNIESVWYSNLGDGVNAGFQGGQSTDPLFADAIHYHLQSSATEGVYTNAYFDGGVFGSGSWIAAAADSPLIARGDPASDYSREPTSNGGRINMGAYGNSEVASKKADTATSAPTVANLGAIEWGRSSALLRGEIPNDGGETAEGYFRYWADGAAVTSVVPRGIQTGAFSHRVTSLVADTLYHYQVGATNSLGMSWSATEIFRTHPAASYFYVASGGDNTAGTNWATAYPNLRTALSLAKDGDAIYLAGNQTFSGSPAFMDDTVFRWQQATNVTLRGGYQAASGSGDNPGANDPETWPTILSRVSGNARILTLDGLSNAVIESVTIRDGYRPTLNQGGGVRVSASKDVRFNAMQVVHNQAQNGAGFYVTGSANVIIESSSMVSNTFPANGNAYGGGFYSATSTLTITNTLIANNTLNVGGGNTRAGQGGGGYVASGTVNMRSCIVLNNRTENWYGSADGYGGGLSMAAAATMDVRDSVVAGSVHDRTNGSRPVHGGGIGNLGTLSLRNVLLTDNECHGNGDGIWSSGTLHVENATIADNNPSRVDRRGVYYDSGTISITNSIIDGHAFDLSNFGAGQLANVWYSNIRDGQNEGEQGCLALDPLFVDRTYYHLQSTVSNYTDAYFEGGIFGSGSWAVSAGDSPLIAKGDESSDNSRELMPNGGRINMGAYGNTEVASMWAEIEVDPPSVSTYGALRWGYTTAHLRGEVTATGGEIPAAFFRFWPSMGGGTTTVSRSLQAGAFVLNATGLTPGTEYNFQAGAENDGGTTWANVEMFSTRALGDPLYVSTNGSDTAGSTWATAYTNLQTAFDLARPDTVVYLAAETFQGSPLPAANEIFTWQNATNVTIRGGYDANPALPVGEHPGGRTGETIFSRSSGNARVLTMSGLSNAVIEQVTIRDGYYPTQNQGGGVHLSNSKDVQFINVIIRDNTVNYRGGGVYITDSEGVVFESSAIVSNRADLNPNYGAGLFMQSASVLATNSLVAANSSVRIINDITHLHGGGIYVGSGGNLNLRRSIIRENFGNTDYPGNQLHSHGGGIFVHAAGTLDARESLVASNRLTWSRSSGYQLRGAGIANSGTAYLRNVLVVGNRNVNPSGNDRGDGIWSDGTMVIDNATIAHNNPTHVENVGVLFIAGSLAITNSIIWGHDTDLKDFPDSGGILLNVSHSLFNNPAMDGENGCINADPRFVDAAAGNYRLRNAFGVGDPAGTSPAIDAGINLPWMTGATDKDGLSRIMKGLPFGSTVTVDMGAYEAVPPSGSMFMFR